MDHQTNFSQPTYRGEPIPKVETQELDSKTNTEETYYKFQLFTPWTVGGLLIILLGNLWLNWTKWQQQEAIKTANQVVLQNKPSAVNLSPRLKLQSLSLLHGAKLPSPTLELQVQQRTNTLMLPTVEPKLSSTLLPHSLHSLTVNNQPYSKYPLSVNVPRTQQTAQSEPKMSVIKINPLPVPNPPPPPNIPTQQAIEQARLEAEQANQLGFNNKTRVKIQAIKTNQDPNELIRNMQQLQQQRLNQLPKPSPLPSK